jgi:Zn-dependent protease
VIGGGGGGFSLGRVLGFPLRLEFTALLVLAMLGLGSARSGPLALVGGLVYAAAVFGSILIHELGHALAARRAGVGVAEIVLHGFGGFARFTRAPNPQQGVGITLAGPGAGLVLGAVALVVTLALGIVGAPDAMVELAAQVTTINVFWSLFNLVPMYPMDGGLVLYHLLARRMPARHALAIAAKVGIGFAGLVIVGALVSGQTPLAIVAGLAAFQCFGALKGAR